MTQQDNIPANTSPRILPMLGIAIFLIALIGGSFLAMTSGNAPRDKFNNGEESEQAEGEYVPFEKWQKPVVALIISGQMHGYVDPCGCSEPQYGGLPRRYNFIQSLKAKKWDVVGVDLGELPASKGIHEQNLLKYQLSVKALATMDYKVMGIGRDELLTPLGEALALIWEKERLHPRPINMTMAGGARHVSQAKANLRQYEIVRPPMWKIGVIDMMGPDLQSSRTRSNSSPIRRAAQGSRRVRQGRRGGRHYLAS